MTLPDADLVSNAETTADGWIAVYQRTFFKLLTRNLFTNVRISIPTTATVWVFVASCNLSQHGMPAINFRRKRPLSSKKPSSVSPLL